MMASAHTVLMDAIRERRALSTWDREAVLWCAANGYAEQVGHDLWFPTDKGRDYYRRHVEWIEGRLS